MDAKTKETQILAKVTNLGRFEVRFIPNPDGTVLYATIENGRTTFSGKLNNWEEASKAWDSLRSKGYAPARNPA